MLGNWRGFGLKLYEQTYNELQEKGERKSELIELQHFVFGKIKLIRLR